MDIASLLSDQAQKFIRDNLNHHPADLMLAGKGVSEVPLNDLVQQIKAHRKAKDKIPAWFATSGIVYGSSKSLEQCSSELTAKYKSGLIYGDHLVDLTGGLGVDTYFFSGRFSKVTYVEKDPKLCALAVNNFKALAAANIKVASLGAAEFLEQLTTPVDCIYIDPDRRPSGRRSIRLDDFRPNIRILLPEMWNRTNRILIKLSPMLDLQATAGELGNIKEIHVVSVKNDCKEFLCALEKGFQGEVQYTGINFGRDNKTQVLTFSKQQEDEGKLELSQPLTYLYQPNASIMKLQPFKLLGSQYNIFKLHPNSHLFTSDRLVEQFPGRIFRIQWTMGYKPKKIRERMDSLKANVAVRNFPKPVHIIRKECVIADGGEDYLFFSTGPDGKLVVICGRPVPSSLTPLFPNT